MLGVLCALSPRLALAFSPVPGGLGSRSSNPGAASGNMNGLYQVATGGKGGPMPASAWNSDYASKGHKFFDVWAPEIATHYGQVFWTDQHNQPLPQHIVDRFKGKTIALTGYEMDQVMVTPQGKPGQDPAQDVSVPINWAYNHRECFFLIPSQFPTTVTTSRTRKKEERGLWSLSLRYHLQ